jgi:hypothetical protein
MNNQQDQTTENLDATTHNVDTNNIQTDNRTEDPDTFQQHQQQSTDQTNSRTEIVDSCGAINNNKFFSTIFDFLLKRTSSF